MSTCEKSGNCQVVLVEDDALLNRVLMTELEVAGIHSYSASTGHQALDLVKSHRPRILILDVAVSDLNGFQIIDALRQDADLKSMHVIVYTALDLSSAERARLSLSGKTFFYTKSREDNIVQTIQKLLADEI